MDEKDLREEELTKHRCAVFLIEMIEKYDKKVKTKINCSKEINKSK